MGLMFWASNLTKPYLHMAELLTAPVLNDGAGSRG